MRLSIGNFKIRSTSESSKTKRSSLLQFKNLEFENEDKRNEETIYLTKAKTRKKSFLNINRDSLQIPRKSLLGSSPWYKKNTLTCLSTDETDLNNCTPLSSRKRVRKSLCVLKTRYTQALGLNINQMTKTKAIDIHFDLIN